MNVNVKDEQIIKELSKDLGIPAESVVNQVISALSSLSSDFKMMAKKISVESAMRKTLTAARQTEGIMHDVGNVLGKHIIR